MSLPSTSPGAPGDPSPNVSFVPQLSCISRSSREAHGFALSRVIERSVKVPDWFVGGLKKKKKLLFSTI